MQRGMISLVINLVGLQNAIYGILGFNNKEGEAILHKVIETCVDITAKKGKELGVDIIVTMTESDGSERFIALDSEKYGKNTVQQIADTETYSQGILFDMDALSNMTGKSTEIVTCNKINKSLNGGLLTQITMPKGTKADKIKKVIEKAASITSSFKPVMQVSTCGNCGLKDEKLGDKCPVCKSTYII